MATEKVTIWERDFYNEVTRRSPVGAIQIMVNILDTTYDAWNTRDKIVFNIGLTLLEGLIDNRDFEELWESHSVPDEVGNAIAAIVAIVGAEG